MNEPYRVFSDASKRRRVAVSVRVVAPNGLLVDSRTASLLDITRTFSAEIFGYCLGLGLTPQGSHVILHYDIETLPAALASTNSVSYAHKHTRELRELRRLMSERMVVLRRVQAVAVDCFYRICHRAANAAAGGTQPRVDRSALWR